MALNFFTAERAEYAEDLLRGRGRNVVSCLRDWGCFEGVSALTRGVSVMVDWFLLFVVLNFSPRRHGGHGGFTESDLTICGLLLARHGCLEGVPALTWGASGGVLEWILA